MEHTAMARKLLGPGPALVVQQAVAVGMGTAKRALSAEMPSGLRLLLGDGATSHK